MLNEERRWELSAKNVIIAIAMSVVAISEAANVRRVAMPSRLVRGDTNVRRLGPWDSAAWIWRKDVPLPTGGEFVRFRKTFFADGGDTPLRFHISADERFVLILDGKVVARGPDRGTPEMWFVQSYETQPDKGEHLLEAVCWRMNPKQSPNAQLTLRGGFLFKAEGVYDEALTTGIAQWKVAQLAGTRMTRDCYPTEPVGAQCEVFGTGIVEERPEECAWETAVVVRNAIPPDGEIVNGEARKPGWMLYPTELPEQIERMVRPGSFKAADAQAFPTDGTWFAKAEAYGRSGWWRGSAVAHPAITKANAMLAGNGKVHVPPRSRLRFLWDLGGYFCSYPELVVSGGRGAKISWGWSESLFTGDCFDWHTLAEGGERKGPTSRAKWTDKYFYGTSDLFYPDGRQSAHFTTPWWRCGRWCQLEIETCDEPLSIDSASILETRYPLEPEGTFECDDPTVADVRRICLRGLQMCMHEMYMDCPYYEQQMYGGDARLQMLIASALSGDGRLTRQSFRLFEMSQRDDGRVSMNYPTTWLQESTTYSLLWATMLGDYALWHDDVDWVRARMPSVRRLLFGVEAYLGNDGLLHDLPGWNFIDWVPQWEDDRARRSGVQSLENLLYLYALRSVAFAEDAIGESEMAARWRRRGDVLAECICETFWNEGRGMVADTETKDCFSEHAQCLAILSNALPPDRERRVFEGLVSADDLARCTVYFSHYLFETYFRFGRGDLFLKRLDLWRGFVAQDLKTPLEAPGDARSDCHAWGSHPLYHCITGLAGIRPTSSGFGAIDVAPCPGGLKRIEASIPTPRGMVSSNLEFDGGGMVRGTVVMPEGLPATFKWRGASRRLDAGINAINMP